MRRHILQLLGVGGLIAMGGIYASAQPQDPRAVRRVDREIKETAKALPVTSGMSCIQVNSSGSQACHDSGGYASTCATAKCPAGYTLTGGGGACSAGDRKLKSLFPRLDRGEYTIVCEQQGVDPQANAICCKLN
ncbi:MAG: hypothetical protein U1A78_04400 [Polyangia bacterium]